MFGSSGVCWRTIFSRGRCPAIGNYCQRALLLSLFASGCLMAGTALSPPYLSPVLLTSTQQTYGSQAHARLVRWQQLVDKQLTALEWHRLLRINHFMNEIPFAEDRDHWGREDFWATPVQFLASNAGDCEDYAIAKLFSLISAGIDPDKLRMAYVTATSVNQPHMVLLYEANPGEPPLVLDNLTKEVMPARDRTDLVPVFSFNASGLWLNHSLERATKIRNQPASSLWAELLDRIHREGVFE